MLFSHFLIFVNFLMIERKKTNFVSNETKSMFRYKQLDKKINEFQDNICRGSLMNFQKYSKNKKNKGAFE